MRRSLAAALCATAILAGAPAAHATSCPTVTDPTGDTLILSGALDLVSGDVVSDGTTVTVAVRVADLSRRSPVETGEQLDLGFALPGGDRVDLVANLSVVGDPTYVTKVFPAAGGSAEYPATGSVDYATSTVRISVPVATYGSTVSISSGTVFSGIAMAAFLFAGPAHTVADDVTGMRLGFWGVVARYDTATTSTTYTVGDAGCITV